MKYIILGLGNFGASLAEKLTSLGNEVIGVDLNLNRVEMLKDKITHVVSLDSTDLGAAMTLPLTETDVVIVGIGEDVGANIMATALMKQLKVKRLISRAISPLQEMVLEAMGVDEIIHPEEETAERWSKKLNLPGIVDSFEVNPHFSVVETQVPTQFYGKTVQELKLRAQYNIILLTTIKRTSAKNLLDAEKTEIEVQGVASAETLLNPNEIMVIYGETKSIKKMLKDIHR